MVVGREGGGGGLGPGKVLIGPNYYFFFDRMEWQLGGIRLE